MCSDPPALFHKMKEVRSEIIQGDCLTVLERFPANAFDLIVTSPPYADRRKNTYGGVPPEKYVEWFLPRSGQFLRVLKPTGTFVLNIKEKAENGERHTFVIELILALRKQGWLWTEEFIWHKKNCYPGKWPNRFRDAWERCLQFNKTRHFKMNQEAVMVPMGDWADKGDYLKLCGQCFWSFISGMENLYTDIIKPLGHTAKERNNEFEDEYGRCINLFTKQFIDEFCLPDGTIPWEKIVKLTSSANGEF